MKWLGPILVALMTSACSLVPHQEDVVKQRIEAEIEAALASRASAMAKDAEAAMLPPLKVELPKPTETEPRFDLSVVNAPAQQVFMAIVNGTPYNMLVGPEVTGSITIELKDVTVKEALEAIRELYGYEYEIKDRRITIQPNTLQTRIFQVNYLAGQRQGLSQLKVTAGSTGATSSAGTAPAALPAAGAASGVQPAATVTTSQVQMQSESNFWKELETTLQLLVMGGAPIAEGRTDSRSGDGRNVVINPLAGVIVVRATPRELRAVEQYLKAMQLVVERQVMLEAKILEVRLSEQYQSGINWASFRGSTSFGVMQPNTELRPKGTHLRLQEEGILGDPPFTYKGDSEQILGPYRNSLATPIAQGVAGVGGVLAAKALGGGFVGLAFQTSNFAALLNFLETQGTVSVLSSPRIATLNNQKAVLKVGTDELFVTNVTTTTTTTTGGSTSTPSVTLQPYFSGISLDVTPQISEDGDIILHIHPAVSVVVEKDKIIDLGNLGQFKLPLASSSVNETDSIVRVKDGQIVAIGGLMSQEQVHDRSGLPGTLNEPLGALFGQRGSGRAKRELVILLKPTIIRDAQGWNRDLEESRVRQQGGASEVKRP